MFSEENSYFGEKIVSPCFFIKNPCFPLRPRVFHQTPCFPPWPRVFHTPRFPHPVFSTPRDPVPRAPYPGTPAPCFPSRPLSWLRSWSRRHDKIPVEKVNYKITYIHTYIHTYIQNIYIKIVSPCFFIKNPCFPLTPRVFHQTPCFPPWPRVFHTPRFPHPVFSTPRDPVPRAPYPGTPAPCFPSRPLSWLRSWSRRHDKIPVEKVNYKIPRVLRSKTRRMTRQDVLRACHVLILKTKGATILLLRKNKEIYRNKTLQTQI